MQYAHRNIIVHKRARLTHVITAMETKGYYQLSNFVISRNSRRRPPIGRAKKKQWLCGIILR